MIARGPARDGDTATGGVHIVACRISPPRGRHETIRSRQAMIVPVPTPRPADGVIR